MIFIFMIWGIYLYGDDYWGVTSKDQSTKPLLIRSAYELWNILQGIKQTEKGTSITTPWYFRKWTNLSASNGKFKRRIIWKRVIPILIIISVIIIFGISTGIWVFVLGAAFTSKASGGADQGGQTTWNQVGVPGAADDVTIQNTHTVFAESNITYTNFTVNGGGVYTTTDGTDWNLIVSNLTSMAGTFNANTSDLTLGSGVLNAGAQSVTITGTWDGGSGTHLFGSINIFVGANYTGTAGTLSLDSYRNDGNNIAFSLNAAPAYDTNGGEVAFIHPANNQRMFYSTDGGSVTMFYDLTINKAGGTVQFFTGFNAHLTVLNDFTNTSGTYITAGTAGFGRNFIVNGNVTNAGTLTLNTATTFTVGTGAFASTINNTGTLNVQRASIYAADTGFHYIATGINWNWDSQSGTCNIKWFDFQFDIITGGSGIKLDMDGDGEMDGITISATDELDCNTHTLTYSGDFNAIGTWTEGTGAVILNGTAQTISNANTWNDFAITPTAPTTITFENSVAQTVNGSFDLNGTSSNVITLVSDAPSTAWELVLGAGATKGTVEWLDVTDSDASGSDGSQKPIVATSSIDGTGNSDWTFTPPAPASSGENNSLQIMQELGLL